MSGSEGDWDGVCFRAVWEGSLVTHTQMALGITAIKCDMGKASDFRFKVEVSRTIMYKNKDTQRVLKARECDLAKQDS